DPARRPAAAGRVLTAAMRTWGSSSRSARADLRAHSANTPPLALYRRVGFTAADRYPNRTAADAAPGAAPRRPEGPAGAAAATRPRPGLAALDPDHAAALGARRATPRPRGCAARARPWRATRRAAGRCARAVRPHGTPPRGAGRRKQRTPGRWRTAASIWRR